MNYQANINNLGVTPLILEDLSIKEDEDLNKKLNELNNSVTQNN